MLCLKEFGVNDSQRSATEAFKCVALRCILEIQKRVSEKHLGYTCIIEGINFDRWSKRSSWNPLKFLHSLRGYVRMSVSMCVWYGIEFWYGIAISIPVPIPIFISISISISIFISISISISI